MINMQAPVRKTLVDDVLVQLRDRIKGGDLKPGDRLPTVDALAEQLGVSRTVVREALARLGSEGWVLPKQGSGVYVSTPPPRAFQISLEEMSGAQDVLWMLELRIAFESEMAALAATRRSADEVAILKRLVQDMRTAHKSGQDTVRADAALHEAIARATGNPYYLRFMEFLGERVVPPRKLPLGNEALEDAKRYLDQVHYEHDLIVAAIEQGDAELAREAARRHLGNSIQRLRGRLERAGGQDKPSQPTQS